MAKNRKKAGKKAQGQNEAKGDKLTSQSPTALSQKAQSKKEKARSAANRKKSQVEGIKKTLMPAILGILAGFVCHGVLGEGTTVPWHFVMLNVILATLILQRLAYPPLGIKVTEFKAKDWFYVEFIAVDLWLVTWTLLLN